MSGFAALEVAYLPLVISLTRYLLSGFAFALQVLLSTHSLIGRNPFGGNYGCARGRGKAARSR